MFDLLKEVVLLNYHCRYGKAEIRKILSNYLLLKSGVEESCDSDLIDILADFDSALFDLQGGAKGLTSEQWGCIFFHYFLGYSIVDTAAFLGISPSAVGSRLRRAVNKLEKMLGGENGSV